MICLDGSSTLPGSTNNYNNALASINIGAGVLFYIMLITYVILY